MGAWQYLTIKIVGKAGKGVQKVVSWDGPAGEAIAAKLEYLAGPLLQDFLREAGKEEWEIVRSSEDEVVLRRYSAGKPTDDNPPTG